MNALPAHEFAVIAAAEWFVLRCPPGRTLALAAALAPYGAWTPTWKRKRRLPRSPISRIVTEACIPGLVFLPTPMALNLPHVPRVPFSFMLNPDYVRTRVPDRQLDPLRRIADRPLIAASKLPRPGQQVRFSEGPWQGLRGKVLACTQRYCSVVVEGFSQAIQAPPVLLLVD